MPEISRRYRHLQPCLMATTPVLTRATGHATARDVGTGAVLLPEINVQAAIERGYSRVQSFATNCFNHAPCFHDYARTATAPLHDRR